MCGSGGKISRILKIGVIGEWLASRSSRFTRGKEVPITCRIEGWMGRTANRYVPKKKIHPVTSELVMITISYIKKHNCSYR